MEIQYKMKERIVGYIDWLKNYNWSKLYKWVKWNYICAFVYLVNIIDNIIKENYNSTGAYFVAICLCFIIHLKEKSLKSSNEIIKMQGELIDNMLSLLNEIDNQKTKKN